MCNTCTLPMLNYNYEIHDVTTVIFIKITKKKIYEMGEKHVYPV